VQTLLLWWKRWNMALSRKITRPFLRLRKPEAREIRFRYEKAGLTVADEPIPWNAEAVLVEARIWLPPGTVPAKSDFQLCTLDRAPRTAVELHVGGDAGTVRVLFRLPPIQDTIRPPRRNEVAHVIPEEIIARLVSCHDGVYQRIQWRSHDSAKREPS
jgi:hypothetical protein